MNDWSSMGSLGFERLRLGFAHCCLKPWVKVYICKMKKPSLSVKTILERIPPGLLIQLGEETKVDHQVKKLTGERVFKLLLYHLIKGTTASWRILETTVSDVKFKQFAGLSDDFEADHSSLATRLCQINCTYFERIHESLTDILEKNYPTEKVAGYKILRFDSTMVSLAGTLLKAGGLHHGVNTRKAKSSDPVDIKFSVGFDGMYGLKSKVLNEQKYLSEDIALPEVIRAHTFGKDEVAVFDRGISNRKSYEWLSGESIKFVTRGKVIKGQLKHEVVHDVTKITEDQFIETDTLRIKSDREVYLYSYAGKKTKQTFRLITAEKKDTGEPIYFISNIFDLTVTDLVYIYRKRWDIECFFKFLKQEFGFKHFLSRSKNGMEVMLYMTLIAFALIHIYYKENKLGSFRVAKALFGQDLEHEILRIIVEQCNGDPKLFDNLIVMRF